MVWNESTIHIFLTSLRRMSSTAEENIECTQNFVLFQAL